MKEKDVELWEQWNRTKSQADLEKLLKQLDPLISQEVRRWTGMMPENMLRNEAKGLAIKAIQSYNPNMGTALSTHVVYGLKKLSRTAYARQSTLSVPEHKRLTFNTISRTRAQFEDMNGRPPTLEELSDQMRLPVKKIQQIEELVGKKELMESGDGPVFAQYTDDPTIIDLAWHDMNDQQRRIFEYRTGYNHVPILSGSQIMKKLSITQGQLSYQLSQIKSILERANALR